LGQPSLKAGPGGLTALQTSQGQLQSVAAQGLVFLPDKLLVLLHQTVHRPFRDGWNHGLR
jgi:hypothetical protein